MRKNYFLSLFLLMTAFWNVEAKDGSKSTNTALNFETTVLAPPGNPSGLNGTPVGGTGTRINLNWIDNASDEEEFEIAYSTTPSGYQTVLTGVGSLGTGSTSTFQLTGLSGSTTYYIAVRAIKTSDLSTPTCGPNPNAPTNPAPTGKTVSCWSNVITVSTNPIAPESPTGAFLSNVLQRSITVNWTDNSTNETNFEIRRGIDGNPTTLLATIPGIAGTGPRTYIDYTVFPTGRYSYQIWAINGGVYSLISTTTGIVQTPKDPPIAPSGLQVQSKGIGLNSVPLFWKNNSGEVETFVIEYSVDNNSWFVAATIPPNDPGYIVNNLLEGQKYFFRVKAVNSGGSSGYTNILQATTLKRVAPNGPTNLTAKTISTTQIDLAWNNGVEDGVTNIRVSQEIYRSSQSATDGFLQIAVIDPYFGTYSDKTGKPKTKYWYKVVSVNYQGQSPFSNVATATTLGPPFAPSDLTTTLANDAVGNTIIKATWKDNSNDEWGFSLERALDSTFTKEVLRADFDSNTVAATSIPIEEGVTYYYRVKASNIYGNSKYSAISTLTTIVTVAPNAPYGLKGSATASEVALTWGDDSNKETAFEIERSDDGKTFTKIGTTARNEVTYSDKTVKEKTKYFYRVRATNIKGNSDYTNVVEITTAAKVSAAIELVTENIFQVYPNPTADGVKVSLSENMQTESGVITITDRMNREVSRTILNNQSEYRLDLSNFTEGTYTISLRTTTQQITKRVYKY
ncbi:fibronectin type III domain-containing protein [Emticicia sp. SJ17W-69]|uniref:fibronectin type III domain-containing protein n=1 Tax=Emticicia sp. SJ17W-69 TaxID=3421657 RepID=UPI003EBA559E